jgi:hypothetical protein
MGYRYLVLKHQPVLGKQETENFAVLVEGKITHRGVLFMVWRVPSPSQG